MSTLSKTAREIAIVELSTAMLNKEGELAALPPHAIVLAWRGSHLRTSTSTGVIALYGEKLLSFTDLFEASRYQGSFQRIAESRGDRLSGNNAVELLTARQALTIERDKNAALLATLLCGGI